MASSEQPQDYRAVMKNALQQIRELKAELAKAQQHRQDPIAIIGIGCRFPTASSTKSIRTPEQFWAFLRDGGDAVSEVPPDRWDVDAYYDPDPATPGKSHIWHGAFLTEVDAFEPQFFNLSPREAITIDPQQRLLLEVSWEALERAGIVPSTLVESQTGVFMGISGSDYGSILVQNGINDNLYGRTGVDISVATGRISYALGLTGPCVAIDTACSSSLVAIHQACQSLHQQECDLALAGGVGLILSPENTIGFSKAGMLSQDGQCKTFDAAANGYVRGEGCGTVVLKRLSDAVADDDQILAVIRGSMVNHDGPSSGLTAPRGPSQQTVIRQALKQANIDPENVSYIEAHGTGTPLGDPIEIGALGAVFRNRSEPLWVGSIKTNLGHLEAAAGIAGLIKIILMLEHEQIPPHLHFQTPNPQIDWAQSPVQIPTVLTNWTMPETAATAATNSERVAGVSSFGFSGTNAHVILSSPPEGTQPAPEPILDRPEASAERSMHLLTLAAKSEPALIGLVKAYQASLEQASEDQDVLNLANICYSAHTSRSHFAHRLGIVASSIEALQETLAQIERGETSTGVVDGHAELDQAQPKVGFLFTGQGSQYVEMGRELYETEPTFRATLEQCDEILKDHLGESLLAILYPGKWASGQVASGEDPATLQPAYLLSQTQYTQPALFVLEVALAQLWHSWGIQPDILMGHSVGEIAAACFAGLFSLEDGLKLIAARGKLMAALPQDGTMVSFMASEEQVQEAIAPYEAEVSIAAINGPESTVISGRRESVLEIAEQMAAQGIKTRELTVSHAFHSPLMEPMLDDFRQVAQSITYHEPKPSLVSNVSGKLASNEVMTADYWVRHVRQAVRFADGVETLHEQGIEIFLEIGPQPILLGMVGDQTTRRPDDQDSPPHPSPKLVIGDTPSPIPEISNQGHPLTLPSLRQNQNDWQQMLSSLGQLYVRGVEIDWEGFDQAYQRQKIVLPTYPFQRQRYWVDTSRSLRREEVLSPLIDKMVKLPTSGETVFETAMSMETFPFLNDHRVYETIVSPGACHLTMVLSAAELTFAQKAESALIYTLADVILPQALALDDDEVRTAQIIYQASEANGAGPAVGFQLISFDEASEETDLSSEVHATGIVGMVSTDSPYQASLKELQIRCSESVNLDLYADGNSPWGKKESSIYFGPSFRWIGEIWRSSENGNGQPTEFLAALYQPDVIASLNGYVIHPGLLDGCFQVAGLAQEWATKQESSQTSETLLPFALERSYFHPSLYSHSTGDTWWCHVEQIEEAKCNIRLFDSLGQIVAELDGFEMRAAPQASIQTTRMRTEWLYTLAWEAMPVPALPEKVEMPDCWLLVGSAEGLSSELLSLLSSDEIAVIRAWDDASIRQTVADLASTYSRIGVVYLDINGKYIDEGVAQHAYQLCSTLLHLTQALIETDLSAHLWIVTQGCQSVEALPRPIRSQEDEKNIPHFDVAAAGALWGLGRTIAQEQPQLQTVCIDLDRDADESQQAELLTKEILVGLDKSEVEGQVAYANQARYVARLAPWQAPPAIEASNPMRLQLDEYGSLENLRFVPMTRRSPAAGEVQVEVKAVGLNFRDVLNSLGMLKEYYADVLGIGRAQDVGLGFECAGIVTQVGEDVTDLAVGDRVMGLGTLDGTFASYITLPASQMAPIPEHLTYEDAATIPMTFLTAWYGLVELANLQPGEQILIHAASGGVGQAAVQIAQAIGAEVFGTASPGKWDHLKEQGITQLMNSRTLAFADEILELTQAKGVDVVLNSLNGDFIDRSFIALGQQGRFVEIGKIGIWSHEQVEQARPDATYYPFDLGEAMEEDPTLLTRLWQALTPQLQTGALQPLPQTIFPAHEAVDAFRTMQQTKQIGKIVISFEQPEPHILHEKATYLITGGLGALGLQMAQQLVEDGAKHLLLTGRRGVTTDEQQAILDQLAEAGAQIGVAPADISQEEDVRSLIEMCQKIAPLRGIVHTAGVLDDGILTAQTAERFETVMRPKVDGTWHLHTLTQAAQIDLDFFICFSSAASMLGGAGQSNYAAANAFMDTLMQQRHRLGLPALSINWGPWAEMGMAAHLEKQMQQQGISMISPQQGRQLFHFLARQNVAQVGVVPFKHQTSDSRQVSTTETKRSGIRELLSDLTPSDREARLGEYLRTEIAAVMGLTNTNIDSRTRLFDFGMDSLMAVELRNRIEAGLGCKVRATLLFDYPTIEVLGPYLLDEVLQLPEQVNGKQTESKHKNQLSRRSNQARSQDTDADHEPIAIVGMGCHYPGDVDTPEAFWRKLLDGFDGIIELPSNRAADLAWRDASNGTANSYIQRGGYLSHVDSFDPNFFGLSPREVMVMDPAHRLLLETAWEALEDANIVPATLFNQEIGVFIGCSASEYMPLDSEQANNIYTATGNTSSTAAGRLSYILGITGPAVAIDTACSSSLVAIHLACQSLRNDECCAALVGGVNLILEEDTTAIFASGNMLSIDGHCKTFDAAADGYVRGEGCGIIVLKRLSDAEADQDNIVAVIRGTAINQDGPSSGLTVPNGPSQERVIRRALSDANLEPEQISYIEAHGTGTPLGDPIEIGALDGVFSSRTEPLYVGSVKTNIGHLEMTAGIAGLMKLALSLQHGQIPPHNHLHTPNPHIEWDSSAVQVSTTLIPWPEPEENSQRIGGVSSFGFSGTNAHVILSEPPPIEPVNNKVERPAHLLTLSVQNPESLYLYAQRYQNYLTTHPEIDLGDLSYTSHVGRSHFDHRLAILAQDETELLTKLATIQQRENALGIIRGMSEQGHSAIAFLFTGQGSQYVEMGRELYESEPTFRATLEQCDEILRGHLGESLLAILYPGKWASGQVASGQVASGEDPATLQPAYLLSQTQYTQPALFALEVALAQLWHSWGIQPDILMGHSVGEIAAACVAGLFSLEDGLKLIAARGKLMAALPQDGTMVSLMAAEEQVQEAIAPYEAEVSIAAINGPESTVISGKRESVLEIADQLAVQGIKTRQLTVSHAFHSPLMEPMLDAFRQVVESITYHEPKWPLVSNVTGKLAGDEVMTADYWVRHVRQAVRFADGIETLHEQGIEIFLEIGPQPTLLGMIEKKSDQESPPLFTLPSLRQSQNDWQQMLSGLAQLYVRGVEIDWEGFDQAYQRQKIVLPTYPFQRQRYWIESEAPHQNGTGPQNGLANWLTTSSIDELTDLITDKGAFENDERETVSRVLATLENENQAQQLTAQVESMLYEVAWERQSNALGVTKPSTPGQWLIINDSLGIGDALAAQLRELGETVGLVSTSDELANLLPQLSTNAQEDRPIRGILYLRAITQPVAHDATTLMQSQEQNLSSLLGLMKLLAADEEQPPLLWVATQNAQQLAADEQPTFSQAPLWGLGRVITLEHDSFWGGLVDLDSSSESNVQAKALLAEILQAPLDGETQVAYRQGTRHLARLIRGKLPKAQESPLAIHSEAAYLVTGGLGALGLLVAEWLAEQGAKKLILTGRRGISNESQQTAIDTLKEQGVEVEIAQVDVADELAMRTLFAQAKADALPLRGVFHTAGVLDDGILLNQDWDRFAKVLSAKVAGSWLLHELTQEIELDFMLFFSSAASLLGNPGQGNYAAANAFMDGLARYRQRQGLPALSINWGAWAEGGMATRTEQIQADSDELISPQLGMAALSQLLSQTSAASSQIGVIPVNWEHFKGVHFQPFLSNFVQPPTPAGTKATLIQEVEVLPSSRRLEHLSNYLQKLVGQILGMSDLAARSRGFADLGMDSLMAMELRRQLESDLTCKLPTTLAFEYPTIDTLATYLLEDVLVLVDAQKKVESGAVQRLGVGMDEPIAIISMACRFPGADTPEAFWQLLHDGVDRVQEMPPSRWDVDDFYDPQRPAPGKMYMREAAFVENVDHFDPLFFGMAPREAVGVDPQHRLLLEVSWEVLERAGLAQSSLIDSQTGVFVGIGESEYGELNTTFSLADLDTHSAVGEGHSVAAGRLAYILGLQGPTMAVDTACSSSLVSLHLACQSLRAGECDLALAGGVNLMLSPSTHVALSQMQALSPDGRCKTFDAAADGYGRGEGGGMVLLKRLSDAEADDDTILAVVKGSAVNHDGPSSGLTVPNKQAQEKLLRQALANAQVTPDEVSYIEAHGTGTSLGDPIEIRALGSVFGADRETPLLVGSAKTNVGHLEAAAGIVGIFKTVLALHHGQIPPHLHFNTPNPYIEWDDFAIEVATTLQEWPTPKQVAGVSSFGLSGTNAHIVLAAGEQVAGEQVTGEQVVDEERPLYLLPLSAKDEDVLPQLAARYAAHLDANPERNLGNLCYAAATGRNHFDHRLAILAQDEAELLTKLATIQQGENAPGIVRGMREQGHSAIAFLFTGQGSQYVEMGRELYETEPTFRATLEQCDEILQTHLGESLLAILYPGKWESGQVANGQVGKSSGENENPANLQPAPNSLSQTQYTQPALFALEVALAQLWHSWGIQPDILMGHSVGEIAAACVAGLFSLEDGLKLIAARGKLMAALPQDGTMVSLMATEEQVTEAIAPYAEAVSIAAINGPESTVISGKRESVLEIADQLAAQGIKTRQLTVSHAFHSPLMEPMLHDFRQVVESITYHEPKWPLVSNVSGELAGDEVMTADYWVRHVRQAVRFADGIETLHEQGIEIFLEIGPQPVLLSMVGDNVPPTKALGDERQGDQQAEIRSSPPSLTLPSLRQSQNDWQQMLSSLAQLYVHGVEIDWQGFDQAYQRQKIILPTYPFQRQRYWVDTSRSLRREEALSPLIDKMVKLPTSGETVFETAMSMESFPFLNDHRVYETIVSPGACHLAMVLSAAELTFAQKAGSAPAYTLTDVILPQALAIDDDEIRTAQIICQASDTNGAGLAVGFNLISFDKASEEITIPTALHATGTLGVTRARPSSTITLSDLQNRFSKHTDASPDQHNANGTPSDEASIVFGPSFRWIDEVWQLPESDEGQPLEILVALQCPDVIENLSDYVIHPGLLDGCFQVAGLAQQQALQSEELHLPFALESSRFYQPGNGHSMGDTWWCHVEQIGAAKCNIRLFDNLGQIVAEVDGFELRAAPQASIQTSRVRTEWLHTLAWEAVPLPEVPLDVDLPECWLIVGDADGISRGLARHLSVDESALYRALGDESIRQRVTEIASTHQHIGVVYLGISETSQNGTAAQHARQLCGELLHLTQALVETDLSARLWVVTQGCQAVESHPIQKYNKDDKANHQRLAVAGAGTLWGLGRTIAQEQPQLQTVCIDLDRDADESQQAELLTKEILVGLDKSEVEGQVAYANQARYVARLAPWQAPPAIEASSPMRLQLDEYGSLENLRYVPMTRRSPAAGEVQVEVKAVGLNFRDVLNSLGMLKEYYADVLGIGRAQDVGLGFECAGIVTQVGEDVTDLAVGDRVMGLGTLDGTFASYITLPASQMAPIPEHLTYADAATIPMTFLTAWYGLVELANLQPGERILIHAASGGVGQAAVQIAQAIGAKVFGTASPGKWDLLREQGITQLMNSRTLAFADEILELTQGKGVDVVLNSLNGDFIDRSFIALGQQGRFVEIGKIGIWSHEQVEQARPDATYYPFDLGEAMEQDSTLLTRLWQALTPQLQTGALQPLPQTIFPAHEAVDAFRTMQQTKQIGKIVISFEQPKPYTLHEKATYLITGGLGALGLQTAYQMVEDGAKHLLLTGRRGVTTNEQQIILDQLTEAGAQIQVIQADIAQEEDVRSLIEMCQKIVPLRGIIHTAGVLDDGILTAQTAQRFEQVMRPKVDGTWHLHSLTQAAQIELDFFICFSSAASMLGGAGQSNYAAANAFMDTLMQHRHQLGLPGLSINWGPWAEVGMAAHLEKQMKQQGISTIPPKQGRQLFQYLSQQNVAQIGVVPFRHQASDSRQVPAAETERSGIRELLSDLTPSDRESRLGEYLRTEIAAVMGLTNTNIDSRTRLFDFGMDSLMAVELRNRIEADLGCQLRATLLFDYPALNVLIPYILHDILDLGSTESHEHVDERDTDSSDEDEQALLDELSEDEISDMLLSKLDRLGF